MTAYGDCRRVETAARQAVDSFIRALAQDARVVFFDGGRHAASLQQRYGDGAYNAQDGTLKVFELKAEERNPNDNFFLEMWSNRSAMNYGWMHKVRADLLFYYFLESDDLYAINFRDLLHWAFVTPGRRGGCSRLFDYQMVRQRKHEQLNDTWGMLVPIDDIRREVGFDRWVKGQLVEAPNLESVLA